jgi:hypothetical protein
MPVGLLGEGVHVNAARGGASRDALPRRASVGVRYGDLETVRRKPARVIEVLVAVAATTAGPFDHDFAISEVAHDSVSAGVDRRGVLSHVRDVAAIRRDEDVLIGPPHVFRNRAGLDAVLAESKSKDPTLRRR